MKVVGRGEAVITFAGITPPDLSCALTTSLKPPRSSLCSPETPHEQPSRAETMLSSRSSSPKLDEKERDLTDVYIHKANDDIYEDGTVDPVYQAKARVLNAAIQEIGMGKYQVRRLWFGAKSVKLMRVGI